MHSILNNIFKEDGIIKKFKDNYIPRPSQIDAANKLLDVLYQGGHMVMEGPCGFGKTFAYLIPLAIKMAEDRNGSMTLGEDDFEIDDKRAKKTIIATNGIALSEQLVYKDLPVVANISKAAVGWAPSYALLKGKGNFLCWLKWNDAEKDLDKKLYKDIETWSGKTNTGDFSELPFKMDYQDQSAIACTNEGDCLGSKCPHFNDCFYQWHRAKACRSDIIVTNYHILFSDWKTGGILLPAYNRLVMDEAHEAAGVFRDFAEEHFSSLGIIRSRNKIQKEADKTSIGDTYLRKGSSGEFEFFEKLSNLSTELQVMEKGITPLFVQYNSYLVINADMELPNEESVIEAALGCKAPLQNIVEMMEALAENYQDMREACYAIQGAAKRTLETIEDIVMFFDGRQIPELQKKYVYYCEKTEIGGVRMAKKHVKVNEIMKTAFFANEMIETVVLTSATLSVGGNFAYIKAELGLDLLEDDAAPEEFIGESPFDLAKQQLWFLPSKCVAGDAKNAKKWEESIRCLTDEIIDAVGGGILFLCTSYKSMNNIYDIACMNDTVIQNGITVFKQGMMPNKLITERFQDDHDSILVATKSFYTGIDIPGDALRCVVIDKPPFPSPAEPVMSKLNKEEGAFQKYSIPMMIMALKQAIGRGVRSIDDKCIIAFMDDRIKTASYAGKVKKSFNYETVATRNAGDVKKFIRGGK